jgi:nucleotide-binding universal stress UspA family protein
MESGLGTRDGGMTGDVIADYFARSAGNPSDDDVADAVITDRCLHRKWSISGSTHMIEIARILCPVDFSDHSRHALAYAAAFAEWYDARLTVLHVVPAYETVVWEPEAGVHDYAVSSAEYDRLVAEVTRFVKKDANTEGPADPRVVAGDVTREILKLAAALPADLLVIGTHGRSGFEHLVLGSVTEKVLRKAICPVLSVPPRASAAVEPLRVARMLCAVDFSDASLRGLAYALSLAQEADAEVRILHVLELPPEVAEALEFTTASLDEYRARYERDTKRRFEQVIPADVRTYCRVETQITQGKAYSEILRVAGEQQTELIVMGVQGHGVVDRLLFGSTTNHVVRQATCPVLTLRLP